MPQFITKLNAVSLALAVVFILPVITGAVSMFSRDRVKRSVTALLESIEFILGFVLAIYLTKKIFIDHDGNVYSKIYGIIPEQIKKAMLGQDMLVYVIAIPLILSILLFFIRMVTEPFYRHVLIPFADMIYIKASRSGPIIKRMTGALWQLPKAVSMTIVFSALLYFSMYFIYSPQLSQWLNSSKEYQLIYNNVLYPALNSNIAKRIPVILGDSFRKAARDSFADEAGDGNKPEGSGTVGNADKAGETVNKLPGGNIKLIKYFNGMTIDDAVKSNGQIDEKAREITAKGKDEKERAYLLYKWISKNISYDYAKAERIMTDSANEKSGSIVAFETRKGICFDCSSLYISMSRAIGLKVRLITGMGYNGVTWGDHAWNQVWINSEKRWVNVDTTFGNTGLNYFDNQNFNVDHKYAEVQAQW